MKRRTTHLLVICICILLTVPSLYGLQYFDPFAGYMVDSWPYGIASGDFNGDTHPDLVTANHAANSVTVLLGNGDGTFASGTHYSTGSSQNPYRVATGDIDSDGDIDIVTGGSMGLVFFYGEGDGTFAAADVYYFVEAVHDVVLADFNNDTYLDIATSHAVRDSVGIHINNHDSTYSTHLVPTGDGTISLATGKLDGDNYTDILVGCNDGTVWNLQNDQSGSFVPTLAHLGVLSDPAVVTVADLNGDNIGDFAVVHRSNDYLYPFLNNGDGTYTVVSGYIVTDNPYSVQFFDVNNDNHEDIFICYGTTDQIELYLNDGTNTFGNDSTYDAGGRVKDMVFADFDDDGYEDMAAVAATTDDAVVFINRLSLILSVDDVTDDGVLPTEYSLEQNYPNPFNPVTSIRFSLPQASHVKIEVFNMLGQSVALLVDEHLTAGIKEVGWNGLDDSGQELASGVYMYRITANQFVDSRSMILLK